MTVRSFNGRFFFTRDDMYQEQWTGLSGICVRIWILLCLNSSEG